MMIDLTTDNFVQNIHYIIVFASAVIVPRLVLAIFIPNNVPPFC